MAGRKNPISVVREHRCRVEQVILDGEWSMAKAKELAVELGISVRQVQRHHQRVRETWAELLDRDTTAETSGEILAQLERVFMGALKDGKYMPALNALRYKAELHGKKNELLVRHVGHDGGPVQVDVQHNVQQVIAQMPTMTDAQLEALARLDQGGPDVIDTDAEGRPLLDRPGDEAGAGAGAQPGDRRGGEGADREAQEGPRGESAT